MSCTVRIEYPGFMADMDIRALEGDSVEVVATGKLFRIAEAMPYRRVGEPAQIELRLELAE